MEQSSSQVSPRRVISGLVGTPVRHLGEDRPEPVGSSPRGSRISDVTEARLRQISDAKVTKK